MVDDWAGILVDDWVEMLVGNLVQLKVCSLAVPTVETTAGSKADLWALGQSAKRCSEG